MELRLTVVGGPDMGRTFSLPAGKKLLVGRGDASDTRINDPSVSRVHFEVSLDGNAVFVSDKGSSSGTCVDGKQIETVEIRPGAVISAGDTKLRLDVLTQSHDTTVVRPPEQPTAVKPIAPIGRLDIGTLSSGFGDWPQQIGNGVQGHTMPKKIASRPSKSSRLNSRPTTNSDNDLCGP